MSLYPATIHKWFIKYNVDPLIGWEALELTAPRWAETEDNLLPLVEDEAELMQSMVDYVVYLIDMAADEYSAVQGLIEHGVPILFSLSPYLDREAKVPLLDSAEKVMGYWVRPMLQAILYPADR